MRRILITGATGFVGAHLLIRLLREEVRIRATYRSAAAFDQLRLIAGYYGMEMSSLYERVEWIKVDLLDAVALDRALFDIDEVYHCAAIVSFSSAESDSLMRTNVEGTLNIVKACLRKEIGKLCYISSIGALNGTNESGRVDETCFDVPEGGSLYSRSKHLSEKAVWEGIDQGLNAVILNPGIIIGPGDITRGSLRFFDTVRRGLLFYTSGVTGYVDVTDVAEAAVACMESDRFNRRFLLVSENLSYRELLSAIASGYGKRAPFLPAGKPLLRLVALVGALRARLTGRPATLTAETAASSVRKTIYDNSRTRAELNMEFLPIAESVKRICRFTNSKRVAE